MIALQAGCQQDPQDGSTLNLSGSVFTTSAVNMTSSKTKDDQDKGGSLPPSAIAGIVVGIVLIFLAAICLFAVHWRREKTRDAWDDSRYFDNYATTPGLYGSQGAVELSKAQRRYFTGTAFGEKESPFTSSGEYYDYVAAETSGRCGSAAAGPRAAHRGRSSALPTHAAYNPNTVSRNSNQSTTGHHHWRLQRFIDPHAPTPQTHLPSKRTSTLRRTLPTWSLNSSPSPRQNRNRGPAGSPKSPPSLWHLCRSCAYQSVTAHRRRPGRL